MDAWAGSVPVAITIRDIEHQLLMQHLFPGDGKEAAAIALCSRHEGKKRHRLLVKEVHGIPYDLCSVRTSVEVSWPTDLIVAWLEKAEEEGLSVVKFHSHPNGYAIFSEVDDDNDRTFFPCVIGWVERNIPHCSVVMVPDGAMSGRTWVQPGEFRDVAMINVVGHELLYWHSGEPDKKAFKFSHSHRQAFGDGTAEILGKLKVAVIGCSGTGSPLIEQLARLGVGELILVDDDIVEFHNLNRIFNTTLEDAEHGLPKVEVLKRAIDGFGLGVNVEAVNANLWSPEVINLVADADLVVGCMDTIDGRYLLNLLATCYLIPYIDIGVRLDAEKDKFGVGKIREVCGTIHYLLPGKSSLISRGLVSMDAVAAAGLKRYDPVAYEQQQSEGYIRGVSVSRPAVISVNTFFASLAVNDFLARIHPYRDEANSDIASIEVSLSSLEFFPEPETEVCQVLINIVAKGDMEPLLGMPEFSGGQS